MATPFTETSPTGFNVTSVGATPVGGVVVELIGANSVRVISQLPASSLFLGFADFGTPAAFEGNPMTIGIQTGFTPAITGALGGGLQSASIRFTLFDGDTAAGNFDFNDNTLLVNGLNFGNWSSVNAQETDGLGNAGVNGFSGGGFRDELLDTGWFFNNNAGTMAALFASLISTQQMVFQLNDVDPFENFFDFTRGIDGGLINVGQGPTIQAVPEPSTLVLFAASAAGLIAMRHRRR
jgi:hypothetical protein